MVQRTTVPKASVGDSSKEKVFSFTEQVLRAWTPSRKAAHSHTRGEMPTIPRLKLEVEEWKPGRKANSIALQPTLALVATSTQTGPPHVPESQIGVKFFNRTHTDEVNGTSDVLRRDKLNKGSSEVYAMEQSFTPSLLLDSRRGPPTEVDESQSTGRMVSHTKERPSASKAVKGWPLSAHEQRDGRAEQQPRAREALKQWPLSQYEHQTLTSTQDLVAMSFAVGVLLLGMLCLVAFVSVESCTQQAKENAVSDEYAETLTMLTHLDLVAALKNGEGTWTQNFKEADANRQMALELLFRCGIVKAEEVSNSRVNQEHVDECVWIATHMLRNRSLEDWATHKMEAKLAFEESVTACYNERAAVHTTQQAGSSTRHCVTRQRSQDEAVLSKDSSGQNLLVKRCKEIMNSGRGMASGTSPQENPSPWHFSTTPVLTPRTATVL